MRRIRERPVHGGHAPCAGPTRTRSLPGSTRSSRGWAAYYRIGVCPSVPTTRWMPTCGGSPGNGPTSPTRTSRGAGSSPGTSACSTRSGRTSGCSGPGDRLLPAKFAWTKIVRHRMVPGGRPPTIPPSPGTGSSGDAGEPPVDTDTWHLLRRQRGRCPLCGGLLLHADRHPRPRRNGSSGTPSRARRSASYLTHGRPGPRHDDQTRLIHASCQRELQARQRRKPEQQPRPATPYGLLEPCAGIDPHARF